MNKPGVFADFHNADAKGRLRLNCGGLWRHSRARKSFCKMGNHWSSTAKIWKLMESFNTPKKKTCGLP